MDKKTAIYDVALSFAGEDRSYVEMVANYLKAMKIDVFYDAFETVDIWGKNLFEHLSEIYQSKAKHTVMFISEHYARKAYTNLERRAAQAQALECNQENILPVRFDDTEISGILPTIKFIDLRKCSPYDLAILICQKLGKNINEIPDTYIPPQKSPLLSGIVKFNYSTHNGIYVIGNGLQSFETRWSSKSSSSIYCCRNNLKGVALALNMNKVTQIYNTSIFDYSSDFVAVKEKELVILKNTNGFYAALEIQDIQLRSHDDPIDEIIFQYWILLDGQSNFSCIDNEELKQIGSLKS